MKDCIPKTLTVDSGVNATCPKANCVANPRVYVAKSSTAYLCLEALNAAPVSSDLSLITGMTLPLTAAGNYCITFDAFISPKGVANAIDDFSYGIFVNGVEVVEARRRVNSTVDTVSRRYAIYTSTSLVNISGPVTVEVRGCLQMKPTNTCEVYSRVLTIYRLP